jgi:hypothetical protein
MGMNQYEEAAAVIDAHPELATFAGPRDAAVIEAAEHAIGRSFPTTYRRFVGEFGAGNFGSFEILGVLDANFEDSAVPDGIWYTLSERRDGGLPDNLLVVGEVGDGSLYCLDLDEGEDPAIVVCEPGEGGSVQERVSGDFGEFLLEGVKSVVLGGAT